MTHVLPMAVVSNVTLLTETLNLTNCLIDVVHLCTFFNVYHVCYSSQSLADLLQLFVACLIYKEMELFSSLNLE